MTATLEMNFENNMAGMRTPLKTPTSSRHNLNQLRKTPGLHKTPGLGKNPGLGGLGTPGKGGICATPRRGLTNITNTFQTPGFKKPTSRLSPNLRIPLKTKTPGHKSSKFSVHFDEDVVLKEMKEKHFTIEEKEICPWDRAKTQESTQKKKVTLELDNVLHINEPQLPSFSPLQLNLDSLSSSKLDSTLELSLDLGELDLSCMSVQTPVRCSPATSDPVLEQMEREGFSIESMERCPWGNKSTDVERKALPRLELEESVIEDTRLSLDTSSFILQQDLSPLVLDLLDNVSELDLSDLPDMPSSPDIERSLLALLDL